MLNVIAVSGRLVSDPELKPTSTGVNRCGFTIACDRNFVKQGEQKQCDFFDIVAWRSSAEFVANNFQKGDFIIVNGSLQTRTYDDRQGNKRKVYEIVADNLNFGGQKSKTKINDSLDIYKGNQKPKAKEEFTVIEDDDDLPF